MKLRNVFIFLTFALLAACSPAILSSLSWQNNPVIIDGNMNEWPNPLRFYDSKSKINYTITNNRKNIFVCMKITDESSQFRMMYAGMEFCIDTLGKKIFPISLGFPTGNDSRMQDESVSEKKYIAKSDIVFIKQKFLSLVKEMELKGFKPPLKGSTPMNNALGITASLNWDKSGILIYEAIIPFSTFYKDELSPTDTARIFNFKIKLNALPEIKGKEDRTGSPSNQSATDVTGNGMHTPGSMGGNSSMNGGRRDMNMGTENLNSEPITIFNKMKLSYN